MGRLLFYGVSGNNHIYFEMIGTIAFAASGALVGSEQKMDISEFLVLGVITAVGGV